jgi:hypothetical protein
MRTLEGARRKELHPNGNKPLHGAVPRLLISAFLERAPDRADETAGRLFYLKIREHSGLSKCTTLIEEIYKEIVAPIPIITRNSPGKGDSVFVRHPTTDEWITAVCLGSKRGRVFTKVDDELIQVPLAGIFWDGKAWREAQQRNEAPRRRASSQLMTAGLIHPELMRHSAQSPKPQFPTIAEQARSDTRALLQTGKQLLSSSKFIDRASAGVPRNQGTNGRHSASNTSST